MTAKVGNTSKVSPAVAGNSPPKRRVAKEKRVESELRKLREITDVYKRQLRGSSPTAAT